MSATDTAPTALLDAVQAWRPDQHCIDEGDRCLARGIVAAQRHWSGTMSNAAIEARLRRIVALVAPEPEPESDIERFDAAYAVARHCAFARVPPRQITGLLVQLADAVPDWWPTDPDDIADLVTAVVMREAQHGH